MILETIIFLYLIVSLNGSFERCILNIPNIRPVAEDLIIAVATNDKLNYIDIFTSLPIQLQLLVGLFFFNSDIDSLRDEATKITQKLFKIKVSFKTVNFENEVTIYNGLYKIDAKFSHSCDISFSGQNSGTIEISGGVIVNKDGFDIDLPDPSIFTVLDLISMNIKEKSILLQQKFKGAIYDGKVSYKFYKDKIQIAIILSNSIGQVSSCEGSIIFTITPGNPPKYSQALENALEQLKASGAITTGVIIFFVVGSIIVSQDVTPGPIAYLP